MTYSALICDIDGCVADISHRKVWEHDKYLEDPPINQMVGLIKKLNMTGLHILFVTGRHWASRDQTREWLDQHFGSFEYELFMREDNDRRPTWVSKAEIYWRDIKEQWDVVYAFDDFEEVCRMWRAVGICALQVTQLKGMD